VPATLLIAIGAFIPTITDSLNRFGSTELFQLGKFLGVVFLFGGFLVSIETFRQIRIPFTSFAVRGIRRERVPAPADDEPIDESGPVAGVPGATTGTTVSG
jgi:hypothetical protein